MSRPSSNNKVSPNKITNWLLTIKTHQLNNTDITPCRLCSRVVLDSWVVSQISIDWLKWVESAVGESAVKIKDMSWVRVESRWSSFESELSPMDTAWVKFEWLIFSREKTLGFCIYPWHYRERTNLQLHSTVPSPLNQQLLAKLYNMCEMFVNGDTLVPVRPQTVLTTLHAAWPETSRADRTRVGSRRPRGLRSLWTRSRAGTEGPPIP